MEIKVTDENFQKEVIERSSKTPILVDFWASWCGPCMMLGPILERVAKQYEGKLIVAKMSVEENQEVPGEYGIMSIPAVKLFKNGKVISEFVGAQPESIIKEWLNENI